MSENINSDSTQLPAELQNAPPAANTALVPRVYEYQMYRNMTSAEQEAALMQIIQDTAALVVKVKTDEQLHTLEKCARIGKLVTQAQRNTSCIRPGGHHGKALVEQIAWRCGICARTLQFYKKMAWVFEEEQLARLVRVDIPWHEAREILNLVGHDMEPVRRLRLAAVLRHLPDNPERGGRKEFSAWLKAMHAERRKFREENKAVPQAGDAPPVELPRAS